MQVGTYLSQIAAGWGTQIIEKSNNKNELLDFYNAIIVRNRTRAQGVAPDEDNEPVTEKKH